MNDFQNIKVIACFLLFAIVFRATAVASEIDPPFKSSSYFDYDCDLCSCSTGSGSFGFGTLNNSNFIGLRYINQSFESRNGVFSNSPVSKETFNTYQLWAQIPVSNKFYVTANLPYQDLNRTFQGDSETINGIGDASVIAWFKLPFYKKDSNFEMKDMEREVSGHSLQFGLGIKLPTGNFEEALADNVNPGFQVGTGSFDGIFSLGYNFGVDKIGVNTILTYYLKGENKNEYQFGNQFSYSAKVYSVFSGERYAVMPFLGLSGDVYNKIKQYNETLSNTEGDIVNTSIGAEVPYKKCILGFSYTLPVSQDLFGGNVKSKNRLSVYLNYAL
ncbi:transporter family protein [Neotamlana laminarinivorans]|uniref:Transporter n=1 Tax=Neotamlana laminarinivorans TaxID=2883124 RepID=A0A9X1HZY7_9FLAO|nr:hypothetical protein [Tamlana laminarinivorans]MCB4798895.1 hypothetical protein [Tamlana laminarinivorans]